MSLVERLEMLRAIRWVDEVLINKGNEDCRPLVEEVAPDLLVVGSDWVGRDYKAAYRDWETDRKSTRLNSSHRL